MDRELRTAHLEARVIHLRVPEGGTGGHLPADAADAQAEALRDECVRQQQGVEPAPALGGLDDDPEGVCARNRDALAGAATAGAEALGLGAGRHGGRVAVLGEIVELAAWADDAEIRAYARAGACWAERGKRDQRRQRRNRDSDSHL